MGHDRVDTARAILEVVPIAMRTIRREMRSQNVPELSIPQFRTLLFIDNHPGSSLSKLAEHLGLMLPSASKLVDLLVNRDLVRRESSEHDRRRVTLVLTSEGGAILRAARSHTQGRLNDMLGSLTPEQVAVLAEAMGLLKSICQDGVTPGTAGRS